ncbi:MAG: efflux RND transporter periplasmic adaptor subunit [candidate division Zixibacteria bacterium]|nr:efflux RND transporter periplasmic adaptor subunit [candidate division Zixibacteria bacterium]
MARKNRKKLFIIGGVVLVAIILVVVNFTRSTEKTTKIKTAKAKQGKLVSLVTASGKVKPHTQVKISANVSGEIVNLPVVEGQRVEKGDLLVQIQPKQYEAQVHQAEAGYDAAQANMKLEEANAKQAALIHERQKSMFEKNLTSKEAYDAARTGDETAQASLQSAQARLQQAKAGVDQSKESLGYTTIRSPIDGYVTDLVSQAGEIVMGSLNYQATVIMVVSDLSEIEVEVEVDETDIANVKLGQSVKVALDATPDTSYHAHVTEIGNTAKVSGLGSQDQVTNFMATVQITDTVPNIKPGMTATCEITTGQREGAVKIPIGAVVLRDEEMLKKKGDKKSEPESSSTLAVNEAAAAGDGDTARAKSDDEEKTKKKPLEGVFLVRNGRAVFARVTTGIADQQNIEVTTGLEKGDEIVVGPFKTLRELQDGDKVEVEKENKDKGKGKVNGTEKSG